MHQPLYQLSVSLTAGMLLASVWSRHATSAPLLKERTVEIPAVTAAPLWAAASRRARRTRVPETRSSAGSPSALLVSTTSPRLNRC